MATAIKPKAATAKTTTTAPAKATAWRYELVYNGETISERPVTRAKCSRSSQS